MTVEKIKNWIKKHKKGIILASGGAAAATVGALVFYRNFRIVPSDSDIVVSARDSIEYYIKAGAKELGKDGVVWENKELYNIGIDSVPWSKLGEAGETLQREYSDKIGDNVNVLFTTVK